MITIDIAGRTGEFVDLVFTTEMNGSATAAADNYSYGQADASLRVTVNGISVNVSRNAKSSGDPVDNDFNPGRVQIQLGTPFSVTAQLNVKAELLTSLIYNPTLIYAGDVSAAFGNSAGITSFELFETGSETLIADWGLSSESGAFGFYSPVPVPASVWLFGSGLIGLIGMARRRTAA